MRILHFGPSGAERSTFGLLGGFMNLGHTVETCNVLRVDNIKKVAETAIKQFQPDMVMTIGGWHQHFDTKNLWQVIKRYGLPHLYWAIEDPTFFEWSSIVHVDVYDFVFTVSEECVPKYQKLGVPAAYVSYGCNPEIHLRTDPDENYKNDIIVLSNKYKEYDSEKCAFRNECFKNLIEPVLTAGHDIMIYGRGWDDGKFNIPKEKMRGYVSRALVPKIYSSAKIVLIIQWDKTGHICYKTYEAFGCRCFQIAPYTPLQAKYFNHGEHIIYSRSPEETLQFVDYYLTHDQDREAIAEKGQKEVYRNHTITVRAREALLALQDHGFKLDFIERKEG